MKKIVYLIMMLLFLSNCIALTDFSQNLREYFSFDNSTSKANLSAVSVGVNFIPSRIGKCANFSSDSIIIYPYNASFNVGTSDWTIVTWVNITSTTSAPRIFGFGEQTNTWSWTPQGDAWGGGIKSNVYVAGTDYTSSLAQTSNINNFAMYVITRNSNSIYWYMNDTNVSNNLTFNKDINYVKPFIFGARNNSGLGEYFRGCIDEFAIYNYHFTQQNVSEAYNCLKNSTSLFSCGLVQPVTKSSIKINQIPSDLNTSNFLDNFINITFNNTNINLSNQKIYWKINSSQEGCGIFINGSSVCGYFNQTWNASYFAGTSNYTEYLLDSDSILPASYNWNPADMNGLRQINVTIGNNNAFVKNRFFNVTKSLQFFDLEAMVINESSQPLHLWYCNSSYTTGLVTASPFCTDFRDLTTADTKHCHTNFSCHYSVPLTPVNGSVNGVGITSTSYFLYQGGTQWNYFYINNGTGSVQATINGGTSWTNLGVTLNSHLHQYSNDTTLWYYTSDGVTQSILYNDTLETSPRNPNSVVIISPLTNQDFNNAQILLNYTQATGQRSIANYIVSFLKDGTTIFSVNNNQSLTYIIANSSVYSNGTYEFNVRANDTLGLISDSAVFFTISNVDPVFPRSTADAIDSFGNNFIAIILLLFSGIVYYLSKGQSGYLELLGVLCVFASAFFIEAPILKYIFSIISVGFFAIILIDRLG